MAAIDWEIGPATGKVKRKTPQRFANIQTPSPQNVRAAAKYAWNSMSERNASEAVTEPSKAKNISSPSTSGLMSPQPAVKATVARTPENTVASPQLITAKGRRVIPERSGALSQAPIPLDRITSPGMNEQRMTSGVIPADRMGRARSTTGKAVVPPVSVAPPPAVARPPEMVTNGQIPMHRINNAVRPPQLRRTGTDMESAAESYQRPTGASGTWNKTMAGASGTWEKQSAGATGSLEKAPPAVFTPPPARKPVSDTPKTQQDAEKKMAPKPQQDLSARAESAAAPQQMQSPTGESLGNLVQIVRGNTMSYYDPKTQREYATIKEAKAGVPEKETLLAEQRAHEKSLIGLRNAGLADRARISAEAKPFEVMTSKEIDPMSGLEVEKARIYDTRTGKPVDLGTVPGQDQETGQPGEKESAWAKGMSDDDVASAIAAVEDGEAKGLMFQSLSTERQAKIRKKIRDMLEE